MIWDMETQGMSKLLQPSPYDHQNHPKALPAQRSIALAQHTPSAIVATWRQLWRAAGSAVAQCRRRWRDDLRRSAAPVSLTAGRWAASINHGRRSVGWRTGDYLQTPLERPGTRHGGQQRIQSLQSEVSS